VYLLFNKKTFLMKESSKGLDKFTSIPCNVLRDTTFKLREEISHFMLHDQVGGRAGFREENHHYRIKGAKSFVA
jgi:hypothetical protein